MPKKRFWEMLFVIFTIAVFVWLKISDLTFRFSDGNIYLYMAKAITEGFWPYKDFILVDPPFLVLLLAGLRLIFGNNLLIYNALPFLFEAGSAILLFLLLRHWKNRLAFLAPLVYLFSFTVLATSDYLTGVQLVVLLILAGILSQEKKYPLLSGVFWGLAFCTKVYTAPALLGFWIFLIWEKKYRDLIRNILGTALVGLVILGPFLLVSFSKAMDYLFWMHFRRPAGMDKLNVFSFFLQQEWFLLSTGFVGIFVFRKKILWLPFGALVLFFLFFKDVYYLYLDSLFPFLVIFSLALAFWMWGRSHKKRLAIMALTIVYTAFLFASLFSYYFDFLHRGKFVNAPEIAIYLKTLHGGFDLYGEETASLLAMLSEKRLFNNYINTATQIFASQTLDLEKVSGEAAEKGVYLVVKIIDRPDIGIKDQGFEGYFSKEVFNQACTRIKEFPNTAPEMIENHIVVYKCKIEEK